MTPSAEVVETWKNLGYIVLLLWFFGGDSLMDTHPNYRKCTLNTHNAWNELPIPAWNHHHRYGYNRNNDWASSWIWWGQNHGRNLSRMSAFIRFLGDVHWQTKRKLGWWWKNTWKSICAGEPHHHKYRFYCAALCTVDRSVPMKPCDIVAQQVWTIVWWRTKFAYIDLGWWNIKRTHICIYIYWSYAIVLAW